MDKNNIAWIFVRALGVYFLAQVMIHIYNLSSLFFSLSSLYDIARLREEAQHHIILAWVDIGITAFQFIIFGLLAYYCLRKGKFIHKLLMYQGGNEKT